MFRASLRLRRSLPYRLFLLVLALAVLNATLPQIVVHAHSDALAEHGAAHVAEHAYEHEHAHPHSDAVALDGSHFATDGLHVHDATGVSAAFLAEAWSAALPRLARAGVPPFVAAARSDFSPARHHRPPIA